MLAGSFDRSFNRSFDNSLNRHTLSKSKEDYRLRVTIFRNYLSPFEFKWTPLENPIVLTLLGNAISDNLEGDPTKNASTKPIPFKPLGFSSCANPLLLTSIAGDSMEVMG
jgi:hypothetical protein